MIRTPLALAAVAAVSLAVALPVSAADVTDDEVGDAASFAQPVKWLGLVSGSVELDTDCSPETPTDPPRTNCIVLNPAPAFTSFDRPDLDKITLPGKSAQSLICHWQTPIANVFWQNPTASTANARISIRPYYRIESDVLADPSLINPQTGLPFGGGFESALTSVNESQPLGAGQSQSRNYTFTRTCIGGLVSRNFLTRSLGLSDAVAEAIFSKPITIRVGLRGSAQLVQVASINVGTRFVGD